MKNFILPLFAAAAVLMPSGLLNAAGEVEFSYRTILDREFRFNEGESIPVTVEKSIQTGGDISADGNFLYYSSNRESGNYDIYLRELSSITTVRITTHPSKDTAPAVSPDGKYLAFASNREDPEGDIYVMKIDASEVIEDAKSSVEGFAGIGSDAKNITQYQDPVSRTVLIIRDADPAWSPDGKWIAFSSKRNGSENIWLIGRDGKGLRQITKKGGIHPRFSADGRRIIYISHREGSEKGDVFSITVSGSGEKQLTSTETMKLYPSFGRGGDFYYTEISEDTDGNGSIGLNDSASLVYSSPSKGLSYAITLSNESSFGGKWLPVFTTKAFSGVVLYSVQKGDSINLALIPETGIIPIKIDAMRQYDFALKYRNEYENEEKYLLGLEMVYNYYGNAKGDEPVIYSARALAAAAVEYKKAGRSSDLKRVLGLLEKYNTEKNNLFTKAMLDSARARSAGKSDIDVLKQAVRKSEGDKSLKVYLPYLLELYGDSASSLGLTSEALDAYGAIMKEHRDYPKLSMRGVVGKHALLSLGGLSAAIPPSAVEILSGEPDFDRALVVKKFLQNVKSEKNYAKRLSLLKQIASSNADNKVIVPLTDYAAGLTYFQQGSVDSAVEKLSEAVKASRKTDLVFYRANLLLADIEAKRGHAESAEQYISSAVYSYRPLWQEDDFRGRISWLIKYYENYGNMPLVKKKGGVYTNILKKYSELMGFVHKRKRFEVLYNAYGARSHVAYIDQAVKEGGETALNRLLKDYEKDLGAQKLNFDKAFIYGLAYINSKSGMYREKAGELENAVSTMAEAVVHTDWALFIDDMFVDAYVLKGWIWLYADLRRSSSEGSEQRMIGRYFPSYLLEKNVPLFEKAIIANDEKKFPDREGLLYLNLGNTYFLLTNYAASLRQYQQVTEYIRDFSDRKIELNFRFHLAYCYWQSGENDKGRAEINRALALIDEGSFNPQTRYTVYKYLALFDRAEGNFKGAAEWYGRILDYAQKHKIKIDRARYLQELAACYYELGNYDLAVKEIKKADILLKEYPEDSRNYKLKWYVFGLFPVPFWDLGQDSVVIGENKIFEPLDTRSKKMLSLSMLEAIEKKKGNYKDAIEYLNAKVRFVKDKKTVVDTETLITSHNNIGYYYYKSGETVRAADSFREAWNISSDRDVNNLKGAYVSLMNLANLYAVMAEKGGKDTSEMEKNLYAILDNINRYRVEYENLEYESRLEALQEAAKAQGTEVSEKEKADLRKQVAEQASGIYYRLDAAAGILGFYLAELRINSLPEKTDPAEILREHEVIIRSYSDSYRLFKMSAESAELNPTEAGTELALRMRVNMAVCLKRLGRFGEAAQALDRAQKAALENGFKDLAAKIASVSAYK